MTVSSSTRKAGPFNGNGVTTSFPFTFKLFATSDLQLTHTDADGVETVLTLDSHYTVSLNADQDNNPGGTITYPASGTDYLATGETLTGIGVLAATQGSDLTNAGRFNAQVIENAFDKLTILIQQMQERVDRTLVVPVEESSAGNLPSVEDRGGKFLAFDVDGNPVPSVGTGSDSALRTDLAADGGSALVALLQSGTGGAAISLQAFLRGLVVTPSQFGAVGNGSADDTTALVNALAAGTVVTLQPGKTYRITSRITVASGKYIVGPRSAIVSMDTGAGFFDSTTLADYDEADGVGFFFNSATSGGLIGFRIQLSNRTAELIAGAVLVRSSSKVQIRDCEFDNFSKAKVLRFESCTLSEARDNYFHDCEISSATTGQLTCIDVDDNRPTGASRGLVITGNRFKNITASAGFITSYTYQTDAINVSHEDSVGHTITNNHIDTVGEGIDVFGANCTVVGNTILSAYNVGIKLVHGARRNVVKGNQINQPGLGGIVIAGSSGDTNNTENNLVSGNVIANVNAAGNWTASNTYGIKCEDDGGAKFARKNLIVDNQIVDGTAMKYGLISDNSSTGNIFRGNMVDTFTTAEFTAAVGSTYTFKSAKTADVQAYQGGAQSVGTGAFEILQLGTESVDAQAEYNAGTYTYTASCPRTLMVHAAARTAAATATKLWELEIRKNGTPTSSAQVVAAGTDLQIAVHDVVDVVKGDTITAYIKHNEAGAVALSATTAYTRLRIAEIR